MAWIESHEELLIHPKTLDLMNLMRWDTNFTIGTLHRFWWWCMKFAQDGDLRPHNASRLAAGAGLPDKQAKRFVDAMVQAEWLDKTPYFRVHNWWQYAGPFLQRKHSRNPHIWQQVRDSYVTPPTTSAIELDESCYRPGKMSSNPHITTPIAQPVLCSSTPEVQQEGCSSPPTPQPASCISTPAVQQEECSSTPTVHLGSCCNTPPNLTIPDQTIPDLTKPDLTIQKKQQQQQNSAADEANHEAESPGRHQQQFTQTHPPVAGIVADTVGPEKNGYTSPLYTGDRIALEQIIYDRIGDCTPLSRIDLEKLVALKNRHGPKFFEACDSLHGRVMNPVAYLQAILEPERTTEVLDRRLQDFMQMESTTPVRIR